MILLRKNIFALIQLERSRQDYKWGENAQRTVSLEARLCILAEEVGEVAQLVNDLRNDNYSSSVVPLQKLRDELVQVAACAVAWLEVTPACQTTE